MPYEVKDLFKGWLKKHFPQRAEHVMSIIRQMRGGKEYESQFGKRMRGEGEFAALLERRFQLACKHFELNCTFSVPFYLESFKPAKHLSPQLELW